MEIRRIAYEMENESEFLRWMEHVVQQTLLESISANDRSRLYVQVLKHWPVGVPDNETHVERGGSL